MTAIQEMLAEIERVESNGQSAQSNIALLDSICKTNRGEINITPIKRRLDYIEDLGKRSVDDT
jgi:hypothetical protein